MTQLKGQQTIDVNAATVKTVQPTKPTAPKKEEIHYEEGKTLTEAQVQKMPTSEKERYFQERDAALDKKCREEQEARKRRAEQIRVIEAFEREEENDRARLDAHLKVWSNKSSEPSELEEDDFDEDEQPSEPSKKKKKSRKQRNVCKKHKVKRRELRRGIETARGIFVPKLAVNKEIPTKVLIAIIDLLENGDIS